MGICFLIRMGLLQKMQQQKRLLQAALSKLLSLLLCKSWTDSDIMYNGQHSPGDAPGTETPGITGQARSVLQIQQTEQIVLILPQHHLLTGMQGTEM